MTKQAEAAPRVRVITKAELARRKGVTRSAVTLAARPGGPLAAACVAGGFIDEAHPACQRWLGGAAAQPPADGAPLVAAARLAELAGLTPEEMERELAGPLRDAVIPAHHVDAKTFARLCGVDAGKVQRATRKSLAAAVTKHGRIDIGHEAALQFAASHPYRSNRKGDPIGVPRGFLAPAVLPDDMIDVAHPNALHYLARCLGRVPTEADLAPE